MSLVIDPYRFAVAGGGPVSVEATANSSTGSETTSHSVNVPAGTGDLWVCVLRLSAVNNPTASWPGGVNVVTGGNFAMVAWGTPSSDSAHTVSVTSSANARMAATTYRIAGAHGDVEAAEAGSLDPPSLAPAWGSAETLWITCAMRDSSDTGGGITFTAPSGYGDKIDAFDGTTGSGTVRCSLSSARKIETASSQDPATWATAGRTNFNSRAWTIAVRPA